MKVLFILKKRSAYGCSTYDNKDSGLFNSAKFVVDMLNRNMVHAKLVTVVDNNDIDREVHKFRPDVVIIEALWVVPEKFDVLKKLHPKVQWIVRGHSDLPFLATEGIAMEWLFGYLKRGVYVAFNSPKVVVDFRKLAPKDRRKILYLPNFYPLSEKPHERCRDRVLRVGCFGAIRPMKNQLLQAVAAIRFADKSGQKLEFHINSARCEGGGDAILKNLRSIFQNTEHKLVENPWLNHEHFLKLMSRMDFALCVSMSETFCITAADAVNVGTPLICSDEIPWATAGSLVPTTSATEIVEKMGVLHGFYGHLVGFLNRWNLCRYSERSREIWLQHFS